MRNGSISPQGHCLAKSANLVGDKCVPIVFSTECSNFAPWLSFHFSTAEVIITFHKYREAGPELSASYKLAFFGFVGSQISVDGFV